MLSELTIENVAVIEKTNIAFDKGLNVLTGETGAGKSILIDSISAILGSRVSRDIVRTGADKAVIWARFTDVASNVQQELKNAGYDCDDELLLQREITKDGKSVCRINGTPATATIVKDICTGIINIHGQHDSTNLLNSAKHMSILDSFAQNESEYSEYYTVYRELCSIKREINALNIDENEKSRQMELLRYSIDEIESAELTIGEDDALTEQKIKIRNSEKILSALQTTYSALNGTDDDDGAVTRLGIAASTLETLADFSNDYNILSVKLNDFYYGAREIASDINDALQNSDIDIGALNSIEERLDMIYRLKQKYGQSIELILEHLLELKKSLENIEFSSERLLKLREEQKLLFAKAKNLADKLTATRLSAFERFSEQITQVLEFLNMPGINFTLQNIKGPLASHGQDTMEFYISTNRGEEPKPLAKIASGGELSRIMLAIKSALADKDDIDTQIYDEIDTGVSGLAAGRIGEKLRDTAKGRQVICITHTAQIASFADTHLLICKKIDGERTYTEVKPLNDDERVNELARIISGDKVTELSLANAREMLFLHR